MEEIETKILDVDRQNIIACLERLGAKKTFDGVVHALFYDFPDGSVRRSRGVIRLRMVGDKAYFTYKEYVENKRAKIRREHEFPVKDFKAMRNVLKDAGLLEWMEMRKKRTTYELPDGTHFELDRHTDQYSYVPEFLEIEAKDISTLNKYVTLLGYTKKDCRPWTILEVSRHYLRKREQKQ